MIQVGICEWQINLFNNNKEHLAMRVFNDTIH